MPEPIDVLRKKAEAAAARARDLRKRVLEATDEQLAAERDLAAAEARVGIPTECECVRGVLTEIESVLQGRAAALPADDDAIERLKLHVGRLATMVGCLG